MIQLMALTVVATALVLLVVAGATGLTWLLTGALCVVLVLAIALGWSE